MPKKGRLIVRNLAFKATEEQVRNHFSGAGGKVVDVNILSRADGRRVGCAFVQLSHVAEAAKAIKQLNGSTILGRPLAVDWAVSKKQYQEVEHIKQEVETEEAVKQEPGIVPNRDP